MNIYLTRHGQTDLNKKKLMQGRVDEPLNSTGIEQAKLAREKVKDISFDAVYSSPLDRAITTASIIGNIDKDKVIIDDRIIEADFGKYEKVSYFKMGPHMTLYWMWPEVIKAPKTAETIASMVERSRSFLDDLKKKDYENVLIVCHGGIIRALCGVLENAPHGIKWRPKPHNCEIRFYKIDSDL